MLPWLADMAAPPRARPGSGRAGCWWPMAGDSASTRPSGPRRGPARPTCRGRWAPRALPVGARPAGARGHRPDARHGDRPPRGRAGPRRAAATGLRRPRGTAHDGHQLPTSEQDARDQPARSRARAAAPRRRRPAPPGPAPGSATEQQQAADGGGQRASEPTATRGSRVSRRRRAGCRPSRRRAGPPSPCCGTRRPRPPGRSRRRSRRRPGRRRCRRAGSAVRIAIAVSASPAKSR